MVYCMHFQRANICIHDYVNISINVCMGTPLGSYAGPF